MEALLHKLYYDPVTGYVSPTVLYNRAKAENKKITKKEVTEWIEKQKVYQLHKAARKPNRKNRGHITSEFLFGRLQADLIDMSNEPAFGQNWILVVVDVFSRLLYARASPTKEAAVIAKKYNEIVDDIGDLAGQIQQLDTDQGGEFGKIFDAATPQVYHRRANVGDHRALGVVDSTIRDFKALLYRYITAKPNEKNIYKKLPDLVKNYNNTPREGVLGATPSQVLKDDFLKGIISEVNEEKKKRNQNIVSPPFNVGDMVRIPAQQGKFKRGFKKQFTDEQHKIVKVNSNSIEVELGPKKQRRRYLFSEVLEGGVPLGEDVFEVEEILRVDQDGRPGERTITRNGKKIKQKLVKFKGYPDPEFVDEDDILG